MLHKIHNDRHCIYGVKLVQNASFLFTIVSNNVKVALLAKSKI